MEAIICLRVALEIWSVVCMGGLLSVWSVADSGSVKRLIFLLVAVYEILLLLALLGSCGRRAAIAFL